MDKTIVGLIGVVSVMAAYDGAQAATLSQFQDAMTAKSYDDLLQPIPNAVALLKTSDAVLADQAASADDGKVELAQYYYYHHHHHHHHFFRPFYHHHHHHHFYRPYYHHHHHHHFYNPY